MKCSCLIFLTLIPIMGGCAAKYLKGKEAISTCSFSPIDKWLSKKPTSVLCISDASMAPQPETVIIQVPNSAKLFKTGKRIKKVTELQQIGTCSLIDHTSPEERAYFVNILKEHNMKIPGKNYSYEVWTDITILDGWLPQGYVEVLRSGSEAWVLTSLCSPS